MEISSVTSSEIDRSMDETYEIIAKAPIGLASVPDTLSIPQQIKPHFIKRALLSVALITVHYALWYFHIISWLVDKIGGTCKQRDLYHQLGRVVEKEEDVSIFLINASENKHQAGYVLSEFIHLPELHPYLKELLEGANVRLTGDKGFFFNLWKSHPNSYQRLSSHDYQGKESYALNHFLFWLDREGNTRFQFEKNPLKGIRGTVYHIIDYLRYVRDNMQQGITGASPYTEKNCINVPIDIPSYLARKDAWVERS